MSSFSSVRLSPSPPSRLKISSGFTFEMSRLRIWFRLTILGLALVSFFGGAGLLLALRLVDDQEMSGMWGIGLIPIMVSIGLFLFWYAAGRELKKLEGPSA